MKSLRIGTRGSVLAMAQADWVKNRIKENYAGLNVETTVIKTAGDRFVNLTIKSMPGKGVFVKEIEDALLRGEIDVAVHSLKDLPTEVTPGLSLAVIPEREDPRDACISASKLPLTALNPGTRIGTGSLRRRAQILHYRRDLRVVPIRGNIDTRLRKLDSGEVDCLVLAVAGLKRIGKEGRISEYLDAEICLGAVAQGALCLETRAGDSVTATLSFLHHPATANEVSAERGFLRRLGGGCHVPVGARAWFRGTELYLSGVIADPDGASLIRGGISGAIHESELLGVKLAEQLLREGAAQILSAHP
ncbi:MAG: hydroxymethylbilane synthase [Candidatus Binatia bacterium]